LFVITEFVITEFVTTEFVTTEFVTTEFVITEFVITEFVITEFVITEFVIAEFVISEFVIAEFVITKFHCIFLKFCMFSLEIKTYTKLNYIEYKPYLGCPIKNLGPRLQPTLFLCENGSEQNLNLN